MRKGEEILAEQADCEIPELIHGLVEPSFHAAVRAIEQAQREAIEAIAGDPRTAQASICLHQAGYHDLGEFLDELPSYLIGRDSDATHG